MPDLANALPDLVNLRDVGGLSTTDGGRVRRGVLLRAATPAFVTRDQAFTLVEQFGVGTRVDLRAAHEVEQETSAELLTVERETGVRVCHLEVHSGGLDWDWAPDDAHSTRARRVAAHYLAYLASSPDSVVAAARALIDGGGSTLVHCSAGKDRTGTVVAVLLDAVGVRREDVLADYGASKDAAPRIRAQARLMPAYQERLAHIPDEAYDTTPEAMELVLAQLDQDHDGGARGYLLAHGLSPEELATLSDRLIEGGERVGTSEVLG